MKFRDLDIGQVFDFTYTFSDMATGPWVKVSARKYIEHTNPFSVDLIERGRHAMFHGQENHVGTIDVDVEPR